ncbi:MAG: hypothetical protein IPL26_06575 [Leptospiraceae bacterium]|nr:hypothetical protein [Leptospiraceae bacterium]MBK8394899.1 hypothetical protein [Leptospiraceae bacterium]
MNSINTAIPGFIVYGFNRIRDVKLIELRNGFNTDFDKSISFYLEQMGNSVYSNDINIKQFEKTKTLAETYAIYNIHYTTKPILKVLEDVNNLYDYLLVSSSEDIVKDYYLARKDFFDKSNSPSFCQIKDIAELIQIPREHFLVKEMGELLVA